MKTFEPSDRYNYFCPAILSVLLRQGDENATFEINVYIAVSG